MTINIKGTEYQENLENNMGLKFYDLSHPWGLGQPCWPYFEDVKIERLHSMARSGVLTQKITTVMHSGTHIDAPAHVVEGTAFMDESSDASTNCQASSSVGGKRMRAMSSGSRTPPSKMKISASGRSSVAVR